jgi:hypothetical protein
MNNSIVKTNILYLSRERDARLVGLCGLCVSAVEPDLSPLWPTATRHPCLVHPACPASEQGIREGMPTGREPRWEGGGDASWKPYIQAKRSRILIATPELEQVATHSRQTKEASSNRQQTMFFAESYQTVYFRIPMQQELSSLMGK